MMRAAAFVRLTRFIKHGFHRCKEDGCWRKGLSCSEIPTDEGPQTLQEILNTRRTFYWQCQEHAMAEAGKRPGPKVISVGDKIKVIECMDPGECESHGNHEASFQEVIEGPGDPIGGPLPVIGFIVKAADGRVYRAKRLEFLE